MRIAIKKKIQGGPRYVAIWSYRKPGLFLLIMRPSSDGSVADIISLKAYSALIYCETWRILLRKYKLSLGIYESQYSQSGMVETFLYSYGLTVRCDETWLTNFNVMIMTAD